MKESTSDKMNLNGKYVEYLRDGVINIINFIDYSLESNTLIKRDNKLSIVLEDESVIIECRKKLCDIRYILIDVNLFLVDDKEIIKLENISKDMNDITLILEKNGLCWSSNF